MHGTKVGARALAAEHRRVEGAADRAKTSPLLEQLPVPVAIYEPPDFRIAMVNAAFRTVFGAEDRRGKPLLEAFPGANVVHAMLAEVCATKEPRTRREYIVRIAAADGAIEEHYFTSLCQPLLDEDGHVGAVIAVGVDVTQEVRARAVIAESRERLRLILDEMPVGVNVRTAATGDVVLTNKASSEILGVDVRDRESPASWNEWEARFADGRLLGPDDHAFRRAMLTGERVRNQTVVLRRVGTREQRVVRSSAAPVVGEGGVPLVVSILDDITDEHRLLEEREQTVRFVETFVGMLGHDLRAPLNAITMGAWLLEHQASPGARDEKRVRQIAASAKRMARMVDDLLDLTRVRLAGGVPVQRKTTDLVPVVAAVVGELQSAHPSATLADELPREVVGEWDGDRLAQVASNLVGNALEYGDSTRPIRVVLRDDRTSVTLAVHNEGAPIPEAVLPVLFDPFRRGVNGATKRSKGLGLGLYIARAIVVAHGGDITVATGRETTFTVTLPRAPPQARQAFDQSDVSADR
jgi:signal transduction histidine kinase